MTVISAASLSGWLATLLSALTLCVTIYGVRLQRRASKSVSISAVCPLVLGTQRGDRNELLLDIRNEAACFLPRWLEEIKVLGPRYVRLSSSVDGPGHRAVHLNFPIVAGQNRPVVFISDLGNRGARLQVRIRNFDNTIENVRVRLLPTK